jgi:hypothetical protein
MEPVKENPIQAEATSWKRQIINSTRLRTAAKLETAHQVYRRPIATGRPL